MKKVLKIVRQTINEVDYFCFYDGGEEALFCVDCSAKTLHGKDIFEKVYLNDSNEIVEVEIDQSSLSDDDKKCFGNHIKELFKEIDNAIKKQFPSQDDGEKE